MYSLSWDRKMEIEMMHHLNKVNISEDRDNSDIPVTCSKCNETFETDSDYVIHYNERHAEI
jgi:uncharacterized C2H2 Zn-finger protein